MMGYGWGMGGGIGMILFWVALILVIVWLVRSLDLGKNLSGGRSRNSHGSPAPDRALDVLRERYARGEIDSDEFERRRRALE